MIWPIKWVRICNILINNGEFKTLKGMDLDCDGEKNIEVKYIWDSERICHSCD